MICLKFLCKIVIVTDKWTPQYNVNCIDDMSMGQNLANKYKEILVLMYLEEKSYQEISDILKKPIGSVATKLRKAKEEFKKQWIKNNL